MRTQQLLVAVIAAAGSPRVSCKCAGFWIDPNHHCDLCEPSLIGTRFVAEFPPHKLTMVGTDDGVSWWALEGTCSGPNMTHINFDFSPKGGPKDLVGIWYQDSNGIHIKWPDGNVWTQESKPTAAFTMDDGLDDHQGLFVDPNHIVGQESFAGARAIAEFPPHTVVMVGSDDGEKWWALKGLCKGEAMVDIVMDFSPKGGPADLQGEWVAAPAREIRWPDGNAWYKPSVYRGWFKPPEQGGKGVAALLVAEKNKSSGLMSVSPLALALVASISMILVRVAYKAK